MKCPYLIKVCSKCNKILVAYSGNFHKQKSGKYGYKAECKECIKQYQQENKEKIAEYQKQYNKQYRIEHKEEIAERMKQYGKQYYEEHKEEIAEYHKQYREEHKEEIAEYKKQYREEHKEEIAERNKQYRKSNPHKVFNWSNNRRTKEQQQGEGINKEQWLEMFNFFNWSCAYSGITLSKETRTIDHIEAIANGGEHEIWNLVPMYRSYNISKQDKDFITWYTQQEYYSEERLNKIYEWCEYAYNKWGSKQAI